MTRFVDEEALTPDGDADQRLRPARFDDFAGQDKVLENLKIFVQAARQRGEAMDHVLLHGPVLKAVALNIFLFSTELLMYSPVKLLL